MSFSPKEIDGFAQKVWKEQDVYKVENDTTLKKCYVLDMFPYPSGEGLHVGHPLGYVASDIYSRFMRMNGYNVLHPMGFDSFGLPTEQYAIRTGISPQQATEKNIANYKNQFTKLGLSFDWSREIITSDPNYYKWTQWIFLEMFDSCYCTADKKAYPIQYLIDQFEKDGNLKTAAFQNDYKEQFTAQQWQNFSEKEKSDILMNYRLAFRSYGEVNWCEALGTVLANDEVSNGRSERGNHPVVKKKLPQWSLRVTAYADRLLDNLEKLEFPHALKEMQRNWIGKSQGATIRFDLVGHSEKLEVFTTRPDTIFGSSFMVLAPEHPLVEIITTSEHRDIVENYKQETQSKSQIERQAEKKVSGVFTGAFALHPFTQKDLPIYIADYVLMDYGTGAIMAVPSEDERDFKFAEFQSLQIPTIYDKSGVKHPEPGDKQGVLINSDFLDGMTCQKGIKVSIDAIEEKKIGESKTLFRLRNANLSRQRYWGEPIPILWKDDIPYAVKKEDLPVKNPSVDSYLPSSDGQSPNSRNQEWVNEISGYTREVDTMPAFAGSSWYFLRYMDPHNVKELVSKAAADYWNEVDLYVGGIEHAVGHLIYSRFYTMFLYDRGVISFEEPYQKMINQGMITGRSQFVYRAADNKDLYISQDKLADYQGEVIPLNVNINMVEDDVLDIEKFKNSSPEYAPAEFILSDGKYYCGSEIEKMSKSKFNVVNPDDIIDYYGSDVFRMYEMFLGPVEQSKPWITAGIEGVFKFIKRFWRLYIDDDGKLLLSDEKPTDEEMKILYKTIEKVSQDIPVFSFNTSVSAFMIAVNELTALKCHKKEILIPLLSAICPFAPHIAENLWQKAGNSNSIVKSSFPEVDTKWLVDDEIEYPVSINGKMRAKILLPTDADATMAEKIALEQEIVKKWVEDKPIKKVIFVPNRMINIVI